MIKIYDRSGNLIAHTSDGIELEGYSTIPPRTVIVYVDYSKQGSESGVEISFEVYEKLTQRWFPVQYDDGSDIVKYIRSLQPGRYRIVIPVGDNEEQFKVKIRFIDPIDVVGEVEAWLVTNYYHF